MNLFFKIKLIFRRFSSKAIIEDGIRCLREEGLWILTGRAFSYIRQAFSMKSALEFQYPKWAKQQQLADKDIERIRAESENFLYRPLVSVLMPVYNVEVRWLDAAIRSVVNQLYDNWELCVVDDCSTCPEVKPLLDEWKNKDSRIKTNYLPQNLGISGASNEALSMAEGEFAALLDHDDVIAPEALYENVKLLNDHPDADMIYSDEDKLSPKGQRTDPYFKPEWSPDLILSHMYTCHLGVYRKSLVDEIGGFRKGFEGAQDWDLVLRLTEKTKNIYHIPKVLYHWRMANTSTAYSSKTKGYAYLSAEKALRGALQRRGIEGEVEQGGWPGAFRVRRKIIGEPLVSIIIPIKDRVGLLKKCVNGIFEKAGYSNYEIIIIDNESRRPKTLEYLQQLQSNDKVKVIEYHRPFNFSAINNFGVEHVSGEHLLFMNNDVVACSEGWLAAMLEHSQRSETGAVGCKLLFPNGTIQHAGVVIGINGTAGHSHKGFSRYSHGYCGSLDLIRNYSAVTAACMMVKKKLFLELGGFDEEHFGVAFNDVDLCLRMRRRGLLIIYTPYAVLYHHESATRGYSLDGSEVKHLQEKWGDVQRHDPYYNPNLTYATQDFSLNLDR